MESTLAQSLIAICTAKRNYALLYGTNRLRAYDDHFTVPVHDWTLRDILDTMQQVLAERDTMDRPIFDADYVVTSARPYLKVSWHTPNEPELGRRDGQPVTKKRKAGASVQAIRDSAMSAEVVQEIDVHTSSCEL